MDWKNARIEGKENRKCESVTWEKRRIQAEVIIEFNWQPAQERSCGQSYIFRIVQCTDPRWISRRMVEMRQNFHFINRVRFAHTTGDACKMMELKMSTWFKPYIHRSTATKKKVVCRKVLKATFIYEPRFLDEKWANVKSVKKTNAPNTYLKHKIVVYTMEEAG